MTYPADCIEELLREAEATHRLLERLPDDRMAWRPHPRSMSLGELAHHIVASPPALAALIASNPAEVPVVPLLSVASAAEACALLREGCGKVEAQLRAWSAADLEERWVLLLGGVPVYAERRGAVVRSLLFSHTYHHRGQLSVFLRLLDVGVPGVYGPSADDALAAAQGT